MGTGRDELDQLTRTELVQRANALGVNRADVLTRLELIDEIVSLTAQDDNERRAARGLLGRARDLVARVMEKGLHLPDAAQRIRTLAPNAPASSDSPRPIATVALAQVYASQGHRSQARKVIDEVLRTDPGNAAALALLDRLDRGDRPPAVQRTEPETEPEPPEDRSNAADHPHAPKPTVPTLDHIEVARRRGGVSITWSLRPLTFARTRASLPEGRLVLRMVHSLATEDGPEQRTEDRELDRLTGTAHFAVPDGSLASHVALGWRDGSTFRVLVTEAR